MRHTLVLAALVNCATFATFAYVAVIATEVAELPPGAVPALLAAFAGATVAGRVGLSRVAFVALPVVWLSAALTLVALVLLPFGGRQAQDLRVVQSGR